MKYKSCIIFLFILSGSLLFGQSPERPKKEIPLITDVVASIKEAQGWMLQNNGEWINNQNKIPFKNYAQNKRKGGKYNLGLDNFDHIDIRSITINNEVLSILLIYSQGGNYEFPVLEEGWNQYNILTYYVFKEFKWNSMFPDSTVFNKPYAVNMDIICTDEIVDYNEESYLFEIENHIRQAIYQQEQNNTNLIFAAYPVKVRDNTYFRFKFYETINKPEIYIKYLLEYNWEKLFRNYYYETDYTDFSSFVHKIAAIDPSKVNSPDYYLHFIKIGIDKFNEEEYRSALQNFIKASMVNPPDTALISIFTWKGKCKISLKSYHEAIEDFDQAIAITPNTMAEKNNWIMAHFERGVAYNAIHDYENACLDWNFALQNGVGEAYDMIKKHCGRVAGDMTKAINIKKSNKYFERGMKKFEKAEHLKALHLFEASWENNVLSLDYRLPYFIGVCRYNLGDYVRSIDDFNLAASMNPDTFAPGYSTWTETFVVRGEAWQKIGFQEQACHDWLKALSLGNASALELIDKFCDNYQAKIQDENLNTQSTLSEGITAFESGNFETSINIFNQFEKNGPGPDAIVLFSYRGNAKNKTGDFQGAINDFTRAIESGADKNTPYYIVWINCYFNRGVSKYLSGDIKGACFDWKKAVELGLNDPDALEYIQMYCED